ncbi:MAG: acetyl-CoA carboxylase biotin carboxyl carrier protein [Planctomycetia bacterium]|nr:acetyl-CoA carboxylase biotin carboxyl carrier protein [Planctomycetia bacterium]
MDHADLERLVKLMNENDLVELEIEEEGRTVRLRKAPGVPLAMPNAMQLLPQMQPMHMAPAPAAAPAAPQGAPAPSGPPAGTVEIRSPIVGTFYKAASPESPAFVAVGDRIKSGAVVCIVEAMKVMNEIQAEVAGEIVEILVENGQAVEFDQPLFRVKTA